MTKQAKARQVAEQILEQNVYSPMHMLEDAYLRGRADERRLCKDIASKVRQALGWRD